MRRRLAKHGFETRFVKMDLRNDYTYRKFKKLGPLAPVVRSLNFAKLPLVLQTNFYVVARKTGPESG